MLVRLLDVSQQDAQDELGMIRGYSIRSKWLCFKFFDVCDAAMAYLLYLVGCIIFADKSGTRVSIIHLSLFENLVGSHRMPEELLH